jgi:hypothetical protein
MCPRALVPGPIKPIILNCLSNENPGLHTQSRSRGRTRYFSCPESHTRCYMKCASFCTCGLELKLHYTRIADAAWCDQSYRVSDSQNAESGGKFSDSYIQNRVGQSTINKRYICRYYSHRIQLLTPHSPTIVLFNLQCHFCCVFLYIIEIQRSPPKAMQVRGLAPLTGVFLGTEFESTTLIFEAILMYSIWIPFPS